MSLISRFWVFNLTNLLIDLCKSRDIEKCFDFVDNKINTINNSVRLKLSELYENYLMNLVIDDIDYRHGFIIYDFDLNQIFNKIRYLNWSHDLFTVYTEYYDSVGFASISDEDKKKK